MSTIRNHIIVDDLNSIATQDLRIPCRLYEQIMAHIQSGIIVCMIDGVEFFAQAAHSSWLTKLMMSSNGLVGLVGNSKPSLIFKMLITSHRLARLPGGFPVDWNYPC